MLVGAFEESQFSLGWSMEDQFWWFFNCSMLSKQEWSLKQWIGCAKFMRNVRQVFRFAREWPCKISPVCTRFLWEEQASFTPAGAALVACKRVGKLWPVQCGHCRFA